MGFVSQGSAGAVSAEQVQVTNPGYANQQEINDKLLYVPLTCTGFGHGLGVQLLGTTLDRLTLSWGYNKAVQSQTVAGQSLPPAVRSSTLTGLGLTGSASFGLAATDGVQPITAGVAVYFANDRFWGVGPAGLLDPAQLTGGGTDRAEGRGGQFTVTAGPGQKIQWWRAARFGQASYNVGGFTGGFDERLVSYTNAAGYTEDYWVGESTNPGLGQTTVNVS